MSSRQSHCVPLPDLALISIAQSRIKMATGKIRADINFINPYPRAKIRVRNPQRVGNNTRTRYPRIPAYPRVRLHTRKF